MKVSAAPPRPIRKMVRFWRRRNASAPSLMAEAMLCISGVPSSAASTCLARYHAKASDSTLIRITSRIMPSPPPVEKAVVLTGRPGGAASAVAPIRASRAPGLRAGDERPHLDPAAESAASHPDRGQRWHDEDRREPVAEGGPQDRAWVGDADLAPEHRQLVERPGDDARRSARGRTQAAPAVRDGHLAHPEAVAEGLPEELGREGSATRLEGDRPQHLALDELEGAVDVPDPHAEQHADERVPYPAVQAPEGGIGPRRPGA